MMRRLHLQFEDERYPVLIGNQCLEETASHLIDLAASSYHIVTDQQVHDLHARALAERLGRTVQVHTWLIEGGERLKSLDTVGQLARAMVDSGADRGCVVVAMGGGVVGNIAGLLAGLLFRGIRLVHVPTTLIAMADSVASLKQAVNLSRGKNLLGCFHTPTAVIADVSYLSTLPPVQIRSGMCEIIKNALIIADENLDLLQNGLRPDARYDHQTLAAVVEAGLLAKQKVMIRDKRERGEAIIFEYGHTVGHGIELAAANAITHGEAVGLGMIVAAEVAHALGHLSSGVRDLHYELLRRNGLSLRPPPGATVRSVMALVRSDNKRGYVRAGPDEIPMILLSDLGRPLTRGGRALTLVDAGLLATIMERSLFTPARIGQEAPAL